MQKLMHQGGSAAWRYMESIAEAYLTSGIGDKCMTSESSRPACPAVGRISDARMKALWFTSEDS
jgi:hypothetical protein